MAHTGWTRSSQFPPKHPHPPYSVQTILYTLSIHARHDLWGQSESPVEKGFAASSCANQLAFWVYFSRGIPERPINQNECSVRNEWQE